jgi:hypothetical protein
VLARCEDNVTRAAAAAGLSRKHMYELIRRVNGETGEDDGADEEARARFGARVTPARDGRAARRHRQVTRTRGQRPPIRSVARAGRWRARCNGAPRRRRVAERRFHAPQDHAVPRAVRQRTLPRRVHRVDDRVAAQRLHAEGAAAGGRATEDQGRAHHADRGAARRRSASTTHSSSRPRSSPKPASTPT